VYTPGKSIFVAVGAKIQKFARIENKIAFCTLVDLPSQCEIYIIVSVMLIWKEFLAF